jgi:hypothetical protein
VSQTLIAALALTMSLSTSGSATVLFTALMPQATPKKNRASALVAGGVQHTLSLSLSKDTIDRRFLLAQPFRNFAGNLVAASRTLKRGVRNKTAAQKSRIARAPNECIKHALDGHHGVYDRSTAANIAA